MRLLFAILLSALPLALALSDEQLEKIALKLDGSANDTWVAGTQTQALLELQYPESSVFNPKFWPPSETPEEVNKIVEKWAKKRGENAVQFADVKGGAAGDPTSLGVAWIMANWTTKNEGYHEAILKEVAFQLEGVPRTEDGAISHRPPSEPVQLWADWVYMVPPFLAYAGVAQNNISLIAEAVKQCELYRKHLRDEKSGLWKHIVLGKWQDVGLWATGNAWAAAGMTRVLATAKNSGQTLPEGLQKSLDGLAGYVNEILDATFESVQGDGLLPNYFQSDSTFSDAASSALLVATVDRITQLGRPPKDKTREAAEKVRKAVEEHVGKDGWLTQVVDPLKWEKQAERSPEGQAFVMLMHAAKRDLAVGNETSSSPTTASSTASQDGETSASVAPTPTTSSSHSPMITPFVPPKPPKPTLSAHNTTDEAHDFELGSTPFQTWSLIAGGGLVLLVLAGLALCMVGCARNRAGAAYTPPADDERGPSSSGKKRDDKRKPEKHDSISEDSVLSDSSDDDSRNLLTKPR